MHKMCFKLIGCSDRYLALHNLGTLTFRSSVVQCRCSSCGLDGMASTLDRSSTSPTISIIQSSVILPSTQLLQLLLDPS